MPARKLASRRLGAHVVTDTAYERIVAALRAHGCKVIERDGTRANSTCPAHEDRSPSLSVRGVEGSVLAHCHAGCEPVDVLGALGLDLPDLYDERRAEYRYDDGRMVKRWYDGPKKRFAQDSTDRPPTLYHLSRLQQAGPGEVFLVEGEKDVHAIEAAGGIATTAPMGAANFAKCDVTPLRGRDVTAVVDRDGPGDGWAAQVAAALAGVAAELRFRRAKVGKDAADHIAAGHELTDFEPYEPPVPDEPSRLDRLRAQLLDDAGLDAIPDPVPLIHGLIYRDSLAWLQGRPGHGKSFVALDWAASVCTGEPWQGYQVTQGPVLYLIAEGGSGFKKRVRAWKKASGRDNTGIRFLPVAVQSSNAAAWGAFCQLAAELQPALVVIDTQARVTVGMEENTSKDMSTFVDRCEDLRSASGATIMVVHHQGRTGEHLRGHSSMEGAATTIVRVEKTDETIKLTCVKQKDEPEFDDIALRLIPTDSSAVLALTETVDSPLATSPAVRRMLSSWWRIHESDLVSVSVLVKSDICTEATFHRSKKALIRAGLVTPDGKGRAIRYKLEKNPDD